MFKQPYSQSLDYNTNYFASPHVPAAHVHFPNLVSVILFVKDLRPSDCCQCCGVLMCCFARAGMDLRKWFSPKAPAPAPAPATNNAAPTPSTAVVKELLPPVVESKKRSGMMDDAPLVCSACHACSLNSADAKDVFLLCVFAVTSCGG